MTALLAARPDVRKVLLFGSLARGEVHGRSDIDLIVVQETDRRFLDRLDEMYALLRPEVACDILVYTPEEMARLESERRFVRRAVAEGQVLHAA